MDPRLAPKIEVFNADDKLMWESPFRPFPMEVSYRGRARRDIHGRECAVVWTGMLQLTVPLNQLKHKEAKANVEGQ
jgi:hypothetical protein